MADDRERETDRQTDRQTMVAVVVIDEWMNMAHGWSDTDRTTRNDRVRVPMLATLSTRNRN